MPWADCAHTWQCPSWKEGGIGTRAPLALHCLAMPELALQPQTFSRVCVCVCVCVCMYPGGSDCKESACNAGHPVSIPRSGRSPGEGNSNQLQDSCLEDPMNRGAWWATVHGVAESESTEQPSTHTLLTVSGCLERCCLRHVLGGVPGHPCSSVQPGLTISAP